MAFTDKCDLYGAIHEEGINRVARHIMRQRPSLFNYATRDVADNPELLCARIEATADVVKRENPLVTVEDPLELPGTGGLIGLNFCLQLVEAKIDFHPGGVIELPRELDPPLKDQRFAIQVRVCAGLGCPEDLQRSLQRPDLPTQTKQRDDDRRDPDRAPIALPTDKLLCFCIDLFVVGHVEMRDVAGVQTVSPQVDAVEIVDIRPDGLEANLECILRLLLHFVVLPRVSMAMEKLTFEILDLATLTLKPCSDVPNNPAIEEDQLKVFIDLEVSS